MPAVPPRSLGGRLKQVTKTVKRKFLRYSIFSIVLLEIISVLLLIFNAYSIYIYDSLVQLTSLLFILAALYRPEKDRFCLRKRIAYKLLVFYYSYGFISVLFKINKSDYVYYCSIALLSIAVFLILKSLKNE